MRLCKKRFCLFTEPTDKSDSYKESSVWSPCWGAFHILAHSLILTPTVQILWMNFSGRPQKRNPQHIHGLMCWKMSYLMITGKSSSRKWSEQNQFIFIKSIKPKETLYRNEMYWLNTVARRVWRTTTGFYPLQRTHQFLHKHNDHCYIPTLRTVSSIKHC